MKLPRNGFIDILWFYIFCIGAAYLALQYIKLIEQNEISKINIEILSLNGFKSMKHKVIMANKWKLMKWFQLILSSVEYYFATYNNLL